MKLSEAIKLGAMLKPQNHGGQMIRDGHTCALAAALDAIGKLRLRETQADYDALYSEFPILKKTATCPVRDWCVFDASTSDLLSQIYHLNDGHKWTREAIADWVEGIERELEAKQAPQVSSASLDTPGRDAANSAGVLLGERR